MEIERKFLIKNDSWKNHILNSEEIIQFYLTNLDQTPTVRLRIKGETGYLTVKYPSVSEAILARDEFEYSIPKADVLAQIKKAKSRIIRKTRHQVEGSDGHLWEIDEFQEPIKGLILAEIELSRIDEPFKIPDWAGEDVTMDGRYSNISLSFSVDDDLIL